MSIAKKSLSIFLSAIMLLSVFAVLPIAANAAGVYHGKVGDCEYLYYLDTKELSILSYGGSTIEADSNGKYPWDNYRSEIKKITTNKPIKTIGEGAFKNLTSLKSAYLYETIETIGTSAFQGCTSLETVTLPASLKTLGTSAFEESGLKSITIPAYVTKIGNRAFHSCYDLASVTMPDSLTEIGDRAFYRCSALEKITLPASLKTIGGSAFMFTGLKSLILPDSVTTINRYAFSSCDALERVTLSKSLTQINDNAFSTCLNLTKVNIPDGINVRIDSRAFVNTGVKSVYIPDGVVQLGYHSFGYEYDSSSNDVAVKDYKIITQKGTAADTYAKNNGITVAYEELVSSADFQVDAPLVEVTPDFTVDSPQSSKFSTTVLWYCESTDTNMKETDVFENDEKYSVTIVLTAKDGYRFEQNGEKSSVVGTVNGKKADVRVQDGYGQGKQIVVKYVFPTTGYNVIFKVAFSDITPPEFGNKPSFTYKTSTEGISVSGNKVEWYCVTDDKVLGSGDQFEAGKTYAARLTLTANAGYQFGKMQDGSSYVVATIGTAAVRAEVLSGYDPKKTIRVTREYPEISDANVISNVAITDFVEPVVGENPSYKATANNNTQIDSVSWYNLTDGQAMTSAGVFAYNKQYKATVYLSANEDYFFAVKDGKPNITVTVNGTEATVTKIYGETPAEKVCADISYVPQTAVVSELDVTDVAEPVVGESPVFTANASYGTVTEVSWYNVTDDKVMGLADTFEYEKEYKATVSVESGQGYKFAGTAETPEVTVSINGQETEAFEMFDSPKQYIVAEASFTTPAPPETITFMAFLVDAPVPGNHPVFTALLPPDIDAYSFEWIDVETGTKLTESDTYVLGKEYKLIIDLDAKAGTQFSVYGVTVMINGKKTVTTVKSEDLLTTEITFTAQEPIKNIGKCKVTGIKAKTFTGKALTQKLTVKDGTTELIKDVDYTVTYKNNKNAGKATVIIKGIGNYEGTINRTFKIAKANNPVKVKIASKTVKLKTVKKKNVTVTALSVKKAQGKKAFKKLSGEKKITVNSKTGKLTVKKGTKKGAYKIKIKITVKDTSNYKSKTITKTVKIIVK